MGIILGFIIGWGSIFISFVLAFSFLLGTYKKDDVNCENRHKYPVYMWIISLLLCCIPIFNIFFIALIYSIIYYAEMKVNNLLNKRL